MLISIPPKYGVSQVIDFINGKSAIHLPGSSRDERGDFTGYNFWAKGYFVSTVGRDEQTIREYIKKQEVEDKRIDQLRMF
jgi:putative transposase